MTDDLIARLRSVDVSWSETGEWCAEAADRIEELETQNEGYKLALAEQLQIRQELESWKAAEEAHHHMLRQELASLTAEVDRLRGLLREAEVKLTDVQGAYATKRYADNLLARIRAALAGTSHD